MEKNDLEMLAEELTDSYKEEIVISKLQKFSMAKYLYNIEFVNLQIEVKLSLNISDCNYYRVESKKNLIDQFEENLDLRLKSVDIKSDNYAEFFSVVVQTMKQCSQSNIKCLTCSSRCLSWIRKGWK